MQYDTSKLSGAIRYAIQEAVRLEKYGHEVYRPYSPHWAGKDGSTHRFSLAGALYIKALKKSRKVRYSSPWVLYQRGYISYRACKVLESIEDFRMGSPACFEAFEESRIWVPTLLASIEWINYASRECERNFLNWEEFYVWTDTVEPLLQKMEEFGL